MQCEGKEKSLKGNKTRSSTLKAVDKLHACVLVNNHRDANLQGLQQGSCIVLHLHLHLPKHLHLLLHLAKAAHPCPTL